MSLYLFSIKPVASQPNNLPGSTYIRLDGSVDLSTAPIERVGRSIHFYWKFDRTPHH